MRALLMAALIVAQCATALAERRIAFVVGNATYQQTTPLRNPVNDSADVAAALRRLGFEVVQGTNLTSEAFDTAIQTFSSKLAGADIALFFYAGHGVQFDGVNYLVPIDANGWQAKTGGAVASGLEGLAQTEGRIRVRHTAPEPRAGGFRRMG